MSENNGDEDKSTSFTEIISHQHRGCFIVKTLLYLVQIFPPFILLTAFRETTTNQTVSKRKCWKNFELKNYPIQCTVFLILFQRKKRNCS